MTDQTEETGADVARRGARGGALIAVAKIYFLVTGLAQGPLLARLLGTEGFGIYGSVNNAISILNNVVVAGSIQSMSAAVAESGGAALRRGLALHVALGLALTSAVLAFAEPMGLHDPNVVPLLHIASVIVGNYTVYAALVGALNGQLRLGAQAGLDMLYATVRTALIVGLAATAWKVRGAVTGFAAASTIILVVALAVVLRRGDGEGSAASTAPAEPAGREGFGAFARRYVGFFAPVLVYQLALNVVLQVDLLVYKGMLLRHGAALLEANGLVGVYKAVQSLAIIPYQLLQAVVLSVFPMVKRISMGGDREETAAIVRGGLRFSALVLGAMLAVLVGLPEGALGLLFGRAYAEGGPALRLLALGQGAFAIMVICTTMLLAARRTLGATALMLFALLAVLGGDVLGVTLAPAGAGSLTGIAAGTASGCALGLLATGVYTARALGAFVPARTLLRAAGATVVAAGAVALVPLHGKLATLGLSLVAAGVYAGVLLVTGEVSKEDRARLAGIVARRKRG